MFSGRLEDTPAVDVVVCAINVYGTVAANTVCTSATSSAISSAIHSPNLILCIRDADRLMVALPDNGGYYHYDVVMLSNPREADGHRHGIGLRLCVQMKDVRLMLTHVTKTKYTIS